MVAKCKNCFRKFELHRSADRKRGYFCSRNCYVQFKRKNGKVAQIEREWGMNFRDLLLMFFEPDYLDKIPTISDLGKILNLTPETLVKYIKIYKIKIRLRDGLVRRSGNANFVPTPTEDYCWTKKGITLLDYLKRLSHQPYKPTIDLIASELNTTTTTLLQYIHFHKIRFGRCPRDKDERGVLRSGRWAYNRFNAISIPSATATIMDK